MPVEKHRVSLTVNGRRHEREVEPRMLLVDFLRIELRLTGTHVGCAHGSCGACTVMIDGRAGRSCTTLALQADGAEIRTVESLADPEGPLNPIQQAFHECHALQCGYCTPGFLMATTQLLEQHPEPTDAQIRAGLAGNLCRCTGYVNIVRAVKLAAQKIKAARA
jgi:aerobic-type carbon monoxide dehydrogenase small subunit (CoxS/CutS family)